LIVNIKSPQLQRNCRLHPLIHTRLEFNLAQDIEGCQGGEKKSPHWLGVANGGRWWRVSCFGARDNPTRCTD